MEQNLSHGKVKQYCFTLIELLVDTAVSSLYFFKRCDKLEQQNTSLFLKKKGGAGERENFFSREKKFSSPPAPPLFSKKAEYLPLRCRGIARKATADCRGIT